MNNFLNSIGTSKGSGLAATSPKKGSSTPGKGKSTPPTGGNRDIGDTNAPDTPIRVPPRVASPTYPSDSSNTKEKIVEAVVDAIPDLIGTLTTQPNHGNDHWPNDGHRPDHFYPDRPSRPKPIYQEPVVATSTNEPARVDTKANKAPKQAKLQTAPNSRSSDNQITKAEYDAASQAVNQAAEEKVAELIGDLGTTVNDPAVAALVKEAQDAAANGTPLSADWQSRFELAVGNSAGSDTVSPDFATTLQDFVNCQNANVILCGGFDPNIPCFPMGNCECIMMPCLPEDDFCMLSPNCCMVGTGGEGCIGVVSCNATELVDMPYGAGEPQSETSMDYTQAVTSGLLIINPAENDTEISFLLDNKSYSLEPGFSRNFTDKDSWEVRFNRGDSSKDARYTVEPGTYVFTPGDKGWDLFRRTINVTVENRGDQVFNYVAGDESIELKSGEALEHSSMYPFFIRFDRGDGQDAVKRFVDKKTELSVAVDPKLGMLDLFPVNQLALAELATNEVPGGSEAGARTALFKSMNKKSSASDTAGVSRSARLMALMKASTKTPAKPAAVE